MNSFQNSILTIQNEIQNIDNSMPNLLECERDLVKEKITIFEEFHKKCFIHKRDNKNKIVNLFETN